MTESYRKKSERKTVEKYAHPILLALWAKDGQTKLELKETTKLGQRAIRSGMNYLETMGCVRGIHEQIGQYNVWTRRWWLAGEGTQDYIIMIRDLVKAGKHRYLPYDHKAKRNMKGQADEV